MDNFMDKLARRFNAGEIIKANAAAEEKELARAKERTAEYERMMQEMRRLNLKNVEITEQVQQLIRSGIEGFEEYDKTVLRNQEQVQGLVQEQLEQLVQEQVQLLQKLTDEGFEASDRKNDEGIEKVLQGTNAGLENTGRQIKETIASTGRETKESIVNTGRETKEIIANANRETKENLNTMSKEMKEQLQRLEEKCGGKDLDFSEIYTRLESLQNFVNEQFNESVAQNTENNANNRLQLMKIQKDLEEHIHRENVKVYRNVQAAVNEQLIVKTREMGDRLDGVERSVKGIGTLKFLAVLTFLAAAGALGLQIASLLNLL